MNERIMRTGEFRWKDLGGGTSVKQYQYRVLSADYRDILDMFWDITEAQQYLMNQVKMEQAACSTGGCED